MWWNAEVKLVGRRSLPHPNTPAFCAADFGNLRVLVWFWLLPVVKVCRRMALADVQMLGRVTDCMTLDAGYGLTLVGPELGSFGLVVHELPPLWNCGWFYLTRGPGGTAESLAGFPSRGGIFEASVLALPANRLPLIVYGRGRPKILLEGTLGENH